MDSPGIYSYPFWSCTTCSDVPWQKRSTCQRQNSPTGYPDAKVPTCLYRYYSNHSQCRNSLGDSLPQLQHIPSRQCLLDALRIQLQIVDLALPTNSDDLMISVDSQQVPSCTQTPRQITTDELKKLLLGSWVTNYEKLFQPPVDVQSTESSFKPRKDGSIKIIFNKPEEAPSPFTTQYMMSSIIPKVAEIKSCDSDGKPQYAFESTDGHCYWDVCNCKKCLASQTDDTEDLKPRKKKSFGRILKERWEKGHKEVLPLGQPSGKFDYLVKQQATMVDPTPWMFSTLPKVPQPLPLAIPSAEPSILRLQRILEEEDKIKKEVDQKSKMAQAVPKASNQFMVQQTPSNPLTQIIHQQCLDQLP
ncbi:hypothetical protein UlMin_008827 [Ulmus minor]